MAQPYETLVPGAPLSQQMEGARDPVLDAPASSNFDPICNFYAYNGDIGLCLYDVCCGSCTYGDARVTDEVLENLPDSLQTPAGRILRAGPLATVNTPSRRCCLPGCHKHCFFLSAGVLPSSIASVCCNLPFGVDCFLQTFSMCWLTVVGGMNRRRLRDKYGITQPECHVAGCSFAYMEPYCCWYWCPLVCAQESRFLRRRFNALSSQTD